MSHFTATAEGIRREPLLWEIAPPSLPTFPSDVPLLWHDRFPPRPVTLQRIPEAWQIAASRERA